MQADVLEQEEEEDERHIEGVFHDDEDVEDGDIDQEVAEGMEVCVYTESKVKRPWVGVVMKVMHDSSKLELHWYEKDKKSKFNRFVGMHHADGSPYKSEVAQASAMVWAFGENHETNSFVISPYWLSYLKQEYAKLDG